jgi:hypothetical protein
VLDADEWLISHYSKEVRYSDGAEDVRKMGIIKWKQKAYQSGV